jgi:hypothetical protein
MSDREGLAELLTEAEWRECVGSFAYFCERFWMIQTPQGARTFELREPQLEGFRAFEDHKLVITLKARQIGWTTLCAAYVFWKAFFRPDWTCIFLSRGEREAVSIMRMVDYGYRRLPEWMRARGPRRMSEAQERFPLENGSLIESLPSKKDPARGRTVNLVIVDEWAFLENAEEAWASIEPITDIGGRLIGLSTANGAGNFFHRLWQRAEGGHSTFKAIFFPWSAVPERDEAWYEQKRRDMLQWQLHQEYPTTPEEAFIKSGNPVFDVDLLRGLPTEDPIRGYLHRFASKRCEFTAHSGGNLFVWREPAADDSYVIGADVAEGLEHGDFSSAHVIGVRAGKVVANWHGHVDPDLFGDVLADLGWWYGTALLGVEANNHGHTTLAQLKRLHYPSLYYQWTYDERTRSQGRKIGWRTTKVTKPLMVDELAMEVRNGSLTLSDEMTIREMFTYVRDEKGGTSGSPFDDRVVSLAIANQMRKHAAAPEYRQYYNDYMTMDWWVKQVPSERDPKGRLGSRNVSRLGVRSSGRRGR